MPLSKDLNSKEMGYTVEAFKAWRSSRKKISRIPDHLWEMASNLSLQYHYPLNRICKKLGLNWGDLKKKITQLSTKHPVCPQKSPSFLELKLENQESFLFNQSPRCAVELTRPDGTVMKIFPSDDASLNILDLCKAFLGSHGSHGSHGSPQ